MMVLDLPLAELSTRELISDVIGDHHRYLHDMLPTLRTLAAKVARLHGRQQTSLYDVDRVLDTLAAVLDDHLAKEERDLFPSLISGAPDQRATAVLARMRSTHEELRILLSVLRVIAADYVAPDWADDSYRRLLTELAHLEAETLLHVQLEDDVLLPRYS